MIPRLKVEHQSRGSLFFRVVSQCQAQRTSGLLTPDRQPIDLAKGQPALGSDVGTRRRMAVPYESAPGTVAFFGYEDTRDNVRCTRLGAVCRPQATERLVLSEARLSVPAVSDERRHSAAPTRLGRLHFMHMEIS